MKTVAKKIVVYILGPTGVGKTNLGILLAKKYGSEIISADSRQFYREMSIGTAKPTKKQLKEVPHHFINSLSVEDEYNVSDFEKDALGRIHELHKQSEVVFVVGGSGLYLHALWNGLEENLPGQNLELRIRLKDKLVNQGINSLLEELDEMDAEARNSIDVHNPVRIMRAIEIVSESKSPLSNYQRKTSRIRPFKQLKIGLNMDREILYERIDRRVDDMIEAGLEDEAKKLIPFRNNNALKTVGYQELFMNFDGHLSREEAIEKIKVHSRRYAKRQGTWFRRYEDIEWFEPENIEGIQQLINKNLK